MIFYEENTAIASLRRKKKKVVLSNDELYKRKMSIIPVKRAIPTPEKKKADETETIFQEYKMPPQPQGYLKFPMYDFF